MFTPSAIQSFNDLEFAIYEYVVQYPEKVVSMSIRELSDKTHVSTTTILRFCKKNECAGFSELKFRLNDFLNKVDEKKIVEDKYEILDNLTKVLKSDGFEQKISELCDLIDSFDQVLFIGGGLSGVVARYAARYLTSAGKYTNFIDDLLFPFNHSIKSNLVIVLSTSGETPELIDSVQQFRQCDCHIVSITNSENSTIAKMSAFNLSYYISEERLGSIDLTSHLIPIYIVESLGKKYMQKHNIQQNIK